MSELLSSENVSLASAIRGSHDLCDHCLGRMFGKSGHGYTNDERGKLLREAIAKSGEEMPGEIAVGDCDLCEGLFGEITHFAKLLIKNAGDYEYSTYLVGTKIDEPLAESEASIIEEFDLKEAEPMKMEVNREVGKVFGELTGKEVSFNNAEITFVLDTAYDHVKMDVRSLFIKGRYCKFTREIPQTKWPCYRCRGRGCDVCGGTGKQYMTSVEEEVTHEAVLMTDAGDESFHGAGREDIDALMLGTGRPFVMELKHPMVRTIDLVELERRINIHAAGKASVSNLVYSDKKEVVAIKDGEYDKTYVARVRFSTPVDEGKLKEALYALRGATIDQRTPSRVAHRRSDLIRKRKVHDVGLRSFSGENAELEITAESGTYIKELVSGDSGKTQPNLSDLISTESVVYELDVIAIND